MPFRNSPHPGVHRPHSDVGTATKPHEGRPCPHGAGEETETLSQAGARQGLGVRPVCVLLGITELRATGQPSCGLRGRWHRCFPVGAERSLGCVPSRGRGPLALTWPPSNLTQPGTGSLSPGSFPFSTHPLPLPLSPASPAASFGSLLPPPMLTRHLCVLGPGKVGGQSGPSSAS